MVHLQEEYRKLQGLQTNPSQRLRSKVVPKAQRQSDCFVQVKRAEADNAALTDELRVR